MAKRLGRSLCKAPKYQTPPQKFLQLILWKVFGLTLEFRGASVSKRNLFATCLLLPRYQTERAYMVVSKSISKSKYQYLTNALSFDTIVGQRKSLIHSESLFPVTTKRGEKRSYFHAKPYILYPRWHSPSHSQSQKQRAGKSAGSLGLMWRKREIGNAQAWYYPADNALVLWECYLFEPYAQKDPRKDQLLATIWQGFEETLLKELPDTTRIYTTYEPIYDRPVYKTFLAKQGYGPIKKVAFVKEVSWQQSRRKSFSKPKLPLPSGMN
jgi:hypothetical protein